MKFASRGSKQHAGATTEVSSGQCDVFTIDGSQSNRPDSVYPELRVTFPGDSQPKHPDFIFLGCGTTSLPAQRKLAEQGFRVLGLEMGDDQRSNTTIPQLFSLSIPLKGDGTIVSGATAAYSDPNWNSFTGGITKGGGAGNKVDQLWAAQGIGGGGLHFFGVWQKPNPTTLDGPLPPAMLPPNPGHTTKSWVQAGGSAWSSANILSLIKSAENYASSRPIDPSRGLSGPILVLDGDAGENLTIVADISAAGAFIPGTVPSPVVVDTNVVPAELNSIGAIQIAANATNGNRSNSATGYVEDATSVTTKGNVVGNANLKWVILTRIHVSRARQDKSASKHGRYVAAGVEIMRGNDLYFIRGKNLVCSLGAAMSGLFWQRSGIGPLDVLSKCGITQLVNSPHIGQNVLNQYGQTFHITSALNGFGQGFPAWGYFQSGGIARRWTVGIAGFGQSPFGVEFEIPIDDSVGHFYILMYMNQPRSRGYINLVRENLGSAPDINMGWYTDGPDPNDPASGLSDPDSDIYQACLQMDFASNIIAQFQSGGNPFGISHGPEMDILYANGVMSPVIPGTPGSGPGTDVYQAATRASRFPHMVPYITMYNLPQSHEAGTVVMGPSPTTGACDGNLKLYGTENCFQCDKSIFPVMPSSGPFATLVATGLNAAQVIPPVARL